MLLSFFLLSVLAALSSAAKYRRVCYYYDPEKVPASKLDVTLCTDIIYYGVVYVNNTIVLRNKEKDEPAILELKKAQQKAEFRLLVCHGFSGVDPEIGSSPEKMSTFANEAVKFLRHYGLDGLDLDWEYPGESDKKNFSAILIALRKAFDAVEPKLSLSIAAASIKTLITAGYEIPVLNDTLDFLSIMSYSYRAWAYGYLVTGHHSPLYPSKLDVFYLNTLNLNWSANYFATQGMSKDRIILGIPTYSIGWKLMFKSVHTLYAPAVGPASPEELWMADICEFLKKKDTKIMWDDYAKVPYASNGRNWYSFDDLQSATVKADYIKANDFGGAMLFSLNADADFNRSCGTHSDFPMHALISQLLNDEFKNNLLSFINF